VQLDPDVPFLLHPLLLQVHLPSTNTSTLQCVPPWRRQHYTILYRLPR
jgi:hypothetical protein